MGDGREKAGNHGSKMMMEHGEEMEKMERKER